MKKLFKILAYTIVVVVTIAACLVGYVKTALPNVGAAPVLTVDKSPANVERGRYLANSVAACMDCHSKRDWTKYAGPLVEGTIGMGGEKFDRQYGFPGEYYSRNITPYGIGSYTDGELYRVITTGVTKDGRAMFPVMPYPYYGKMAPEDVYAIIAYLRTLPAIPNQVATSVSDFPMNVIINMIPKKQVPMQKPDSNNRVAYGAYLINMSACMECHTKEKQGQIIPDLAYSGGRKFKLPSGGTVVSANITPDLKTGIGAWTEEAFVNRFKAYADSSYHPPVIGKGNFNSVMPWNMYGHMSRSDLAAIYAYLHSLPARENMVMKFESGS